MKKKLIPLLIAALIIGIVVWLRTPAPMFKNPDSVRVHMVNYEVGSDTIDMLSFASNSNIDMLDTESIADILADQTIWRFPKSVKNYHSVVKGDLWLSGIETVDGKIQNYNIYLNPENPELNIMKKLYLIYDFSIYRTYSIRNAEEIYEQIMAVLPSVDEMIELNELN